MKRITAAISALLVMAALFAIPAQAQTTQDVLNKMIEAMGGAKALQQVKDTTLVGTMEMGQVGMSATFTMYQKEPDKIRMDIEIMGMVITQAFDGTKAWFTNPQTQSVEEMPEAQGQALKRQAMGNDAVLNPAKYGITYTLKPKETVDGIDCIVLEQKTADGHTATVYIDSSTYLTYKNKAKTADQSGQEVEVETYPSDYKKVDGLVVAHALKTLQGGNEVMRLVFTQVSFNKGLDDAFFKMK